MGNTSPTQKAQNPFQRKLTTNKSGLTIFWGLVLLLFIIVGLCITLGRYMSCAASDNSELYHAIESNDLPEVQRLLSEGHDPNSTKQCYLIDNEGYQLEDSPQSEPALFIAVQQGNPEMVSALLTKKANPNQIGKSGFPALVEAIMEGKYDIVAVLLNGGANPNWKDPKTGETPLILAVKNNQVKNVIALLSAGAEKNVRDRSGNNAIFYAADDGEVRSLLQK
jgi:ankyrin repeat protein